jgi:hypothetical protein
MTHLQLNVSLEPQEENSELAELVEDAFGRCEPEMPIFTFAAANDDTARGVVARSPEVALRWICQHVKKRRLMTFVNKVYKEGESESGDSEEATSENDAQRSRKRSKTKRSKSNKELTTKQFHRRLKEQLDIGLLDAVANTQDIARAKEKEITYSDVELRYREFAKQLTGIGVGEVAQMINRAGAVATFPCIRDWAVVLQTWREAHRNRRRLFAHMASELPLLRDESSDTVNSEGDAEVNEEEMMALTQPPRAGLASTALTSVEVSCFQELLASVRRTESAGILSDMRHRWVMAALYAEYLRLDAMLRKRVTVPSRRGRGMATIVREQLFNDISQLGQGTSMGEARSGRWRTWNRYLDYGKRWYMLKQRFGVGIFALLPRAGAFNSFVERRPLARLEQWMDMVATCNKDARDMAMAIEPLLVSCMEEGKPPGQLLLETVNREDYKAWTCEDLFMPVDNTQTRLEEIDDDEESDNGEELLVPNSHPE